ncbi:BNR repeat-like domain protein [Acinetobacter sp. 742879]|uniref:sialidase family protein n=1 Tax=Acinetobacter sp. 742879 TaxID=1310791 RepID=UPI000445B82C|nr:sialidase family protein [Acinetobacter sp. 742879]EXS29151.1 BNR repeat-like domain protein [Acinetobacter sp. 742879]
MDEMLEPEDIAGAKIDLENIRQGAGEDMIVNPRSGLPYKSLPMVSREAENRGGFISAPTLDRLQEITPSYNWQLGRDDSTGNEYRWDPQSLPSPSWVPTGRNSLIDAQKALDGRMPLDAEDALERHEDSSGFMYEYTTKEGGKKLVGLDGSVQDNLNDLKVKVFNRNGVIPYAFEDSEGNVFGYFDEFSNLHLPNNIYLGNKSLLDVFQTPNFDRVAGKVYQDSLKNKYPPRSEFTSIITRNESDGLRNRMIAAIKISTGLFMVWHRQTKAEYDGDGSGSAFWCGFADIDSNFNITVRDRKLFIYPDSDAGIVKHPHLGRTNDNRLIMVYEKSIGYVEETSTNKVNYIRYVRYSSDEGVTWTEPLELSYINNPPTSALKALGTTCEVLKLKTGRLIVALYSATGHAGCIYSDNNGISWAYSNVWIIQSNWGQEPSITFDSKDNLIMSIRPKSSNPMFAAFAKSTDSGETWKIIHTNKVASVTNQSFLFYDSALGLHIVSHDIDPTNKRIKFRLSLSYDDCNTFPIHYAPFLDTKYVGYTQLIKWVDGIYLLLMEHNETWVGLNTNEDLAIQLLTISEIVNNVTSI